MLKKKLNFSLLYKQSKVLSGRHGYFFELLMKKLTILPNIRYIQGGRKSRFTVVRMENNAIIDPY